jgi:hypothetical protein
MKMKKLNNFLLFLGLVIIVSCTKKETTPPSAGETNAITLAGAKGSSKIWSIVSISESINGGAAQTVSTSSGIPTCESDNVYTFSHDTSQSYQQTEGATVCTTGDANNIESGSWAFSEDGKSLFIEATIYPTSTQFSNESTSSGYFLSYLILSVGKAWTVTQITATSLTMTYSGTFTDSSTNTQSTYVDTLVFASKN